MDNPYFNMEGYPDPTAAEAIRGISGQRSFGFWPVVYIASPYSGEIQKNVENAKRYCRYAISKGRLPIAPHLYFPAFMSDQTERDLAMFFDLVLLTKCCELWVMGDVISEGMKQEIAWAKQRYLPIRYIKEADL